MIKVLITDKLAQEGIDVLNSIEGIEAVVKTGISEDELAGIIGEHDGLIIRSGTKVTAKVLDNPGKLKAIARAGVSPPSAPPRRLRWPRSANSLTPSWWAAGWSRRAG